MYTTINKNIFAVILIFACFFVLFSDTCQPASQDAVISSVQLATTRDDLIGYFKVENAFNDEINQAILKGIPASFSYHVSLERVSRTILNKEISDFKVTSTLKYNTLKKEFIVKRSWKNEKPFITNSFEEAKELMIHIDNLPLARLSKLEKGEDYELEIKADLDKVTLPLKLHYILFFVSFWDSETDWHLTKFTY